MTPDELLVDDDAVTPVIGIILLVAIAVILAATVGTLAFTLSDRETNPAPSVSFTYEYDEGENNLTVIHDGGSKFDAVNVEFRRNGAVVTAADPWPAAVQAGDAAVLDSVDGGDEVLIVWTDPRKDDQSQIIGEWDGPEA